MIHITHNVAQLTEEEKGHLQKTSWFAYVNGVGLIYLSNGTWNCTNCLAAKAFLEQSGIREISRDTSHQNQ